MLITGCIAAGLAVFIGAFGAHGLKDLLSENQKITVFETGVKYQFYHAIAILIIGLITQFFDSNWFTKSYYCMILGIVFFSGSLYLLSILNINLLGIITPLGGLLFLVGWLFLILGIKKAVLRP